MSPSARRRAGAAVWALERLAPGESDPGLTGDLLEELAEGRSARWLWGQVGMAMLARYGRMVRSQWPALLFALLWSVSAPALVLIQRENYAMEARFWRMNWPWSTVCDLGYSLGLALVFLWTGLVLCVAIYSMATRRFEGRRLWRGIWLCIPLYAVALAAVWVVLSAAQVHAWIDMEPITYLRLIREPVFIPYDAACWCALSVAILAALPRARRKRAALL